MRRRRARSKTDCRRRLDNAGAPAPRPRARRSREFCRSDHRTTSSNGCGRARAAPARRRAAEQRTQRRESVSRLTARIRMQGMMHQQHAKRLLGDSCARVRSSASSCARPSLPVAINGGVGTAEDTPISATGPRRRTNGNASFRLRRRRADSRRPPAGQAEFHAFCRGAVSARFYHPSQPTPSFAKATARQAAAATVRCLVLVRFGRTEDNLHPLGRVDAGGELFLKRCLCLSRQSRFLRFFSRQLRQHTPVLSQDRMRRCDSRNHSRERGHLLFPARRPKLARAAIAQ